MVVCLNSFYKLCCVLSETSGCGFKLILNSAVCPQERCGLNSVLILLCVAKGMCSQELVVCLNSFYKLCCVLSETSGCGFKLILNSAVCSQELVVVGLNSF